MERIESIEDQMRGIVTYRLSDERYVGFDAQAVREYGITKLLESVGEKVPTERSDVMQHGRKVGSLPGDFDPLNIKSKTFLYEPRYGDFRREGDVWLASRTLGPSDLEAVPGFRRA